MRVAGSLSQVGQSYSGTVKLSNSNGETANIVHTLDIILLGIGRNAEFTAAIDGEDSPNILDDLINKTEAELL